MKLLKLPRLMSEDETIQLLITNLYNSGYNNKEVTKILLAYLQVQGLIKLRKAS